MRGRQACGGRYGEKALSLRGEHGADGPGWSMSQAHHCSTAFWSTMPRAGPPNCNRLRLDLGAAKQPCNLGTFLILSGLHVLFMPWEEDNYASHLQCAMTIKWH